MAWLLRSVDEIRVLAGRSLRRTLRNRSVLLGYIFQPLLYLLVFTQLFEAVGSTRDFQRLGFGSYLSFFLPALLVFAVLPPALTSGLATVVDLQLGTLDGFLRTPVRRSSLLLGRLVADSVRMLVQTVALVGIAAVLGAQLGGPVGVVGAIGLAVGIGLAFAGLSNLIALRSRSVDTTSALSNLLVLPLMFVSTAYMPADLLPTWLRWAAAANPLTYVINGSRRLLTGSPAIPATDLLVAAVLVAGLMATTVMLSARAFLRATA